MQEWGKVPAGTDTKIFKRFDLATLMHNAARGQQVIDWPLKYESHSIHEVDCNGVLQKFQDRSGLMFELYRVCAPSALLRVVVPYWTSIEACGHPPVTELFFEALCRLRRASNGFAEVPLDFETVEINYEYYPDWEARADDAREFARKHYFNVVRSMTVFLRCHKPMRGVD